jgi:hypothetical protein
MMRGWAFPLIVGLAAMISAPVSAADPRTVFSHHDPESRLPNTHISKLGVVHVGDVRYDIYYLDFENPVSLHGMQQIAMIRNGTRFAGAFECMLEDGRGKLFFRNRRLIIRIYGMTFVVRFDKNGPTQNKYLCGEGSGWQNGI